MPTSATGTWTSNPRSAGFTLVEILVVVVIVGIMAVAATLSLGVAGGNRDIEGERDRLLALLDYVREQAGIENREYGLRLFDGGYQFVVYDDRAASWVAVAGDRSLRLRHLPPGLETTLVIEGRRVVLAAEDEPRERRRPPDLAPQVLLYSSGDVNAFELELRRRGTSQGVRIHSAASEDAIESQELGAS